MAGILNHFFHVTYSDCDMILFVILLSLVGFVFICDHYLAIHGRKGQEEGIIAKCGILLHYDIDLSTGNYSISQ